MSSRKQLSCGRDLNCVPNLLSTLDDVGKHGFDFVSIPLVHPRYKRDFLSSVHNGCHGLDGAIEPLTRSDMMLSSGDWMSLIVGKVSPWIQLHSPCTITRSNSKKALLEELSYSAHLNIPVVLLFLQSADCVHLAHCLLSHFGKIKGNQAFWICVPLIDSSTEDCWQWWNKFRNLCGNDKKISIVLNVGVSLPSVNVRNRWLGEPVRAIFLSTDVFLTNSKGFPVLRRSHQDFLQHFYKLDVQVILTGVDKTHHGIASYRQYLDYLHQKSQSVDNIDTFAKGYNDYLQNPLQPLMDNLDSYTYEVFEKDPVKYHKYEEAVALVLKEKIPDDLKATKEIVVMVVGAGRGPLVQATLNAAKRTERNVKVYAIEKNPGAVVTLRNCQRNEWPDCVTVVACDMRQWEATEKADILVSELLGSFGDNELSPECLDGAQRFLKDDGVSIPCSYNSYLVPISAPKLYSSIDDCREKDKVYSSSHYETPYVVRLWNANTIGQPKKCFTFCHPKGDFNNDRYSCLKFQNTDISCVIHGLAGYFDAVLYNDISISILPETHTKGMISWFPIFFPLKEPLFVEANCAIEVHIWRCSLPKKVWYEWAVTLPIVTSIHNPYGRSYWIGL